MDPDSAQSGSQQNLNNSQTEAPAPDYNQSSATPTQETPTYPSEQPQSTLTPTEPVQPVSSTEPLQQGQIAQTFSSETVPAESKGSKKGLFILLFLFLFLIILLAGASGLAYAVAYEKIKLTKYPDIQKKVASYVISLPFMPKTPKFLLAKTAMAHQDVTKQSYDISLAIDSNDLTSSLGLNTVDLLAKGAVDYSNPQNINATLDMSITKDFNFEMMKKDKMLYFRINKFPAFLLAFMGIKTSHFDSITGKWVGYDTTPLETEARESIQKDKEVDPLSEEFLNENFDKYIDEEILSKMKLEETEDDGYKVYKLTLDADSSTIDHLGKKIEESSKTKDYVYPSGYQPEPQKLSDMIKKLKWEFYIDKKSYYTRKVIISADIETDNTGGYGSLFMGTTGSLTEKSRASLTFAVKFDNFGEDVKIEVPETYLTFEEFTNLLSESFNEIYGNAFKDASSQARDARRMSDLMAVRTALEMFYVDCSEYPNTLTDLTTQNSSYNCVNGDNYMTTIPKDPDGTDYYYATNGTSFSLCAKLEAPSSTENDSCPDPSFNYHIKNP